MNQTANLTREDSSAEMIRVRGLVQGVGFRPTVWRLAHRHGLTGWVTNDGDGVQIRVAGTGRALDDFVQALIAEAPPLSRIETIERLTAQQEPAQGGFEILESQRTDVRTGVVPDAVTCAECKREVFDPFARRFRYPFTNCTHCGPRLSITESVPYDRATTTMREFPMCTACRAEYENPSDRRFHAQPLACHVCGPRAWLERGDGAPIALDAFTTLDGVDGVCTLLQRGHIVAIKGLGGFQLACDACDDAAVSRLRRLKHRDKKPFALMARDLEVIERFCKVGESEAELLASAAGPIVILESLGAERVASSVAPGVNSLGFMLPATPLHHLVLRRMGRPIVLTSGNLSEEPQCITNADALDRLRGIAEYFLFNDRDIARRVDDSVVRLIDSEPRVLRGARGYAPAPIPIPEGFALAPDVIAFGAELKNTFCLFHAGRAIVSHHMGDLEDARTYEDYRESVFRYLALFGASPKIAAIDMHPEYLSSKLGREQSARDGMALEEIQHHHAHIASCMAENGIPLGTAPVLGIALDGIGYGDDGTLWGGEFLLADYRIARRLATFKPVVMPGGEQAIHEPWRSTYAHLMAEMGWDRFATNYSDLDLFKYLEVKPRLVLDDMMRRGINSPQASSCGRLFDAVAAACGVARDSTSYEGQAAMEWEALVDEPTLNREGDELAYPFAIPRLKASNLPYVEPLAMWQAVLGDLILGTPIAVIAARFHKGLAIAIVNMTDKLSRHETRAAPVRVVALSGGVFQNRVLHEQVCRRLGELGFQVLTHRRVPSNDGGLSLGQAAVAAARAVPH